MSGGLFTSCVLRACARYWRFPQYFSVFSPINFYKFILNFEFILIFYITKFTSYHQASMTSWELHCERKLKMEKIYRREFAE